MHYTDIAIFVLGHFILTHPVYVHVCIRHAERQISSQCYLALVGFCWQQNTNKFEYRDEKWADCWSVLTRGSSSVVVAGAAAVVAVRVALVEISNRRRAPATPTITVLTA